MWRIVWNESSWECVLPLCSGDGVSRGSSDRKTPTSSRALVTTGSFARKSLLKPCDKTHRICRSGTKNIWFLASLKTRLFKSLPWQPVDGNWQAHASAEGCFLRYTIQKCALFLLAVLRVLRQSIHGYLWKTRPFKYAFVLLRVKLGGICRAKFVKWRTEV